MYELTLDEAANVLAGQPWGMECLSDKDRIRIVAALGWKVFALGPPDTDKSLVDLMLKLSDPTLRIWLQTRGDILGDQANGDTPPKYCGAG